MSKLSNLGKTIAVSCVVIGTVVGVGVAQEVLKVDAAIAAYKKISGISGSLSSIGSDTLNNAMTLWAETFNKLYPNVRVQIEGKGSSTAPPSLIAGTSQLGPMSRSMKGSETDAFEKKFGYKPTEVKTAVDGLALFVNKDNPIKGLTLEQIDAIFSKTRRAGNKEDIVTWGQLGLTGDWATKPLSLYGRNSASGTYGFFKDHVLKDGDFKDTVKEQPGSAAVVQGVSVDRYGIGYSGIGYKTSGIRATPLAVKAGQPFIDEGSVNVYSGKYPLARFLFVYVNKTPNKPLDPLTHEFLKLILSREGQEVVIKDGYFSLPAKVVSEELAKLN